MIGPVLRVDGKATIGRGLRHIRPNEFDLFHVPPSDKSEDLGYKDLNGLRAHGYRWWHASDGEIDEARFMESWLSADLASLSQGSMPHPQANPELNSPTSIARSPDPKLFEIPPDYKAIYQDRKPSNSATGETPHPAPASILSAPGTPDRLAQTSNRC